MRELLCSHEGKMNTSKEEMGKRHNDHSCCSIPPREAASSIASGQKKPLPWSLLAGQELRSHKSKANWPPAAVTQRRPSQIGHLHWQVICSRGRTMWHSKLKPGQGDEVSQESKEPWEESGKGKIQYAKQSRRAGGQSEAHLQFWSLGGLTALT